MSKLKTSFMDGFQGVRQNGVHLHGGRRVGGKVQGRLPPAQVSRTHQTSLRSIDRYGLRNNHSELMFELWSFVNAGGLIDIEYVSCVAYDYVHAILNPVTINLI